MSLEFYCAEPADSPEITLYTSDISHALVTMYHPYSHEPSALTKYLKQKLHLQHAKHLSRSVTDPSMTLAHKVSPGLQDLQKQGQRILAGKKTKEAKENMWIGRMVAAESLTKLDGLIRSRAT